jgi:hypothetical protein
LLVSFNKRIAMDKDRVAGAAHQVKGAVKETVGTVPGDGKIDRYTPVPWITPSACAAVFADRLSLFECVAGERAGLRRGYAARVIFSQNRLFPRLQEITELVHIRSVVRDGRTCPLRERPTPRSSLSWRGQDGGETGLSCRSPDGTGCHFNLADR